MYTDSQIGLLDSCWLLTSGYVSNSFLDHTLVTSCFNLSTSLQAQFNCMHMFSIRFSSPIMWVFVFFLGSSKLIFSTILPHFYIWNSYWVLFIRCFNNVLCSLKPAWLGVPSSFFFPLDPFWFFLFQKLVYELWLFIWLSDLFQEFSLKSSCLLQIQVIRGVDKLNQASKTIFLACEEDMEEALSAVKKGIWTFSSDWFMNCIMKQELDLDAPQFAESL